MSTFKISILFCYFIFLIGCATGSHIITGEARQPIDPSQVKLYLDLPDEYEKIGIVEASSDVEFSTQAAQDRAIQELKNQAAKIGANGVLLQSTGNQTETSGFYSQGVYYPIRTDSKTAAGIAIFIK